MLRVLLVEPDLTFRARVEESWSLPNSRLHTSEGGAGWWSRATSGDPPDVILFDAGLLQAETVNVVDFLRRRLPETEIGVLATTTQVDAARDALARGASRYLLRPVDVSEIEEVARKAAQRLEERRDHRGLQDQLVEDLLGDTVEMRRILRVLRKVAPSAATVLITGESGTGKEFLSGLLHRMSSRSEGPFIAVNCGAIPDSLLEAELFGARKGSYTGAIADRRGLLEEADGGTLLLDEIGDLSASAQVKLLRFLQNHELRRVGETEVRRVDVRVVAATHRDLGAMVRQGTFREDLWWRLQVIHLEIPPLRRRREVIPSLLRFFVHRHNQRHNRKILGMERDAEAMLLAHNWPGNVRELEHVVEHAVLMAEADRICLHDLPDRLLAGGPRLALPPAGDVSLEGRPELHTLAEVERRHVLSVLKALDGNQSEAALRLGISRSTLWRKLREWGMEAGETEG